MSQGPYHIIPIGILLLVAYLGSLLSVRMQLVDQSRHRRLWNVILLLFFISSALLGLFMAIKVNYKLKIPWIDPVTQWHVDMGIGLAIVAVFHLTWHLGYYKKILKKRPDIARLERMSPFLEFNPIQVKALFVMLGFITMITQLVMLREFVKSLHGNELVIGLFLSIWMVLTAAGALAGSRYMARISGRTLLKSILLLAAYPVILYLLLIWITRLVLLPGIIPGILSSISQMALLIIPFNLVSGFLFSYLCRSVKSKKVDASFYMLDSVGSMTGGLLFGLILVFFMNNIQVILLLFLITAITLVLLFKYPVKRIPRMIVLCSGMVAFGMVQFPEVRNQLESLRFKGEKILDTKDTPQGNLTFAIRDGQTTGYLDMNPIMVSFDPARCEELVHYPALQHPAPVTFLVIGGGLSGIDSELEKYKPRTVDYCEANRWIYRMGKKHLPVSGKYRFIRMDGRSWLMKSDTLHYDVIISAAGEPLTLGWNRYFTVEYFRLVKSRLSKGGIFSLNLPAGGNYVSDPGSDQLGITYYSLKEVFDHVLIVPGQSTYFVASQAPLSLDYPSMLQSHSIQTTYVNPDYLDATRLTFESDLLLDRIRQEKVPVNSDLRPVLFFISLAEWNLKTSGNRLIYIGLISGLVFLLLLFSYPRKKAGMFIAGFTGAGMQILLIMVMQSFYGFAYMVTPLMITLFMGGLVAGTLTWQVVWRAPTLSKTTGLMWIMALLGAAAVIILKSESLFQHRWSGFIILGLLNFLPGMIVGSVFGLQVALLRTEAASGMGSLYSADLAGAALGTLVPPLFLLPLIGVSNTFILFCGINVAAGLYIQTGKIKS
jgi:spermidine synthase